MSIFERRVNSFIFRCVMELPVFGRNRPEGKILETVGVFETVKQHGKYETGQVCIALHCYGDALCGPVPSYVISALLKSRQI